MCSQGWEPLPYWVSVYFNPEMVSIKYSKNALK